MVFSPRCAGERYRALKPRGNAKSSRTAPNHRDITAPVTDAAFQLLRAQGVLIAGPQATLNAANIDGRDPTQAAVEMAALVNVSIFSDISPIFTWGIESNVAATTSDVEWRLLPQVHAQLEKHWRIQAAAGVEGGLATPPSGVVGLRVIAEM